MSAGVRVCVRACKWVRVRVRTRVCLCQVCVHTRLVVGVAV